ncbi:MAG: hypothetical protein ACH36H_08755 [Candidatus Nanopelagicales bacterium]
MPRECGRLSHATLDDTSEEPAAMMENKNLITVVAVALILVLLVAVFISLI